MFALCDEEDFLALPQSTAEGEEERRGERKLEQRNVEIEARAGRQEAGVHGEEEGSETIVHDVMNP